MGPNVQLGGPSKPIVSATRLWLDDSGRTRCAYGIRLVWLANDQNHSRWASWRNMASTLGRAWLSLSLRDSHLSCEELMASMFIAFYSGFTRFPQEVAPLEERVSRIFLLFNTCRTQRVTKSPPTSVLFLVRLCTASCRGCIARSCVLLLGVR